jgi:hypothetical protein
MLPMNPAVCHKCHFPTAHHASQIRRQDVSPCHSRIGIQPPEDGLHRSRCHGPEARGTDPICFTERQQQASRTATPQLAAPDWKPLIPPIHTKPPSHSPTTQHSLQ